MEKPKRKPKDERKAKEPTAQIEFVAPYPLPDCLLRIRDTKSLDTGFMSPGIDPSFEKIEAGVYRFKIRRTWYDTRYRRHYSYVELDGYLKGLDETSTVVIAKTRISWMTLLLITLLGILFLFAAFSAGFRAGGWIFLIGAGVMVGVFGVMIYFDRRTLIRLIYRVLSDDLT